MYIVYDKNDFTLKCSNSIRDFDMFYEIRDGESGNSIDYEIKNGSINYNQNNDLSILYNKKINKIRGLRELSVEYNGDLFTADDFSVSRMVSNISVMENEETVDWKSSEGKIVILRKEDLVNIIKKINLIRTEIITDI